jgi:molybdopterin synthase sulfur carrier subunit
MKVKVKFFASVREAAGVREDDVELPEGATLRNLIDELSTRHGRNLRRELIDEERNQPSQHIQYLIVGENARQLSGYETKMKDGLEVAIIPPVGGGSIGPRSETSSLPNDNTRS